MIRLVIADDHSIVREGLRAYLSLDSELTIIGEARNGREAVEMVRNLVPDVILMDLMMPYMGGLDAIAAIRRDQPGVQVVALTSAVDDLSAAAAVRAGAVGYVRKSAGLEELRTAIRAAAAANSHSSAGGAGNLVQAIRSGAAGRDLTPREMDVLLQLGQGRANKQIAQNLGVSEQTVKSHVSNILGKLQVSSRTEAALYAVNAGLIGETKRDPASEEAR